MCYMNIKYVCKMLLFLMCLIEACNTKKISVTPLFRYRGPFIYDVTRFSPEVFDPSLPHYTTVYNRPFNLHPIFSFEKMGAFATLTKIG